MTTYEAAKRYTKAGLHILPIKGDGSKAPLTAWKEYQTRLPREDELHGWFHDRHDRGIAIQGGHSVEILDVERRDIFEAFAAAVEKEAPGLIARLTRVETPGKDDQPGDHLYYRAENAGRNQVLASDDQGKRLIETRGDGGYVVAPPSPACCHRKNGPYVHVSGPALPDIPRITAEERDLLIRVARSFDHVSEQGKGYIESAPLAKSGEGGHNITFMVARHLVNDLGLPKEEARELLNRYNDRLGQSGEEMWSAKELHHKLESAADRPLTAEPANDPHRLARSFCEARPWVFWNGRHFEYTGTRYVEVPDYEVAALLADHIKQRLDAAYREKCRHDDNPRRPVFSRALVRNALQALESKQLVRSTSPLPSLLPKGQEANLLGFRNGLLDLETLELRPHTPDWFSLVCLPYAYDPAAQCPRWRAMLETNLEGDAERIGLLQEFFGYALMNSTDAQRFLFLVGEGANGKSVVLAGLHAMLGEDNVSTVPLEDFGKRFATAQTLGKLVNICPEVGELDRTAEGTLKAFVSGDRMTFERKGKDAFTARPTARLVLSTNNIPRFSDKSEGVWRRLLLLPFTRQIPVEERVAGMDKPEYWLREGEAAGILNWALEGMKRLQANGMRFVEPAACRAALQEHRVDSDPCRAFLEEHYTADAEAKPLKAAEVYRAYREWCEQNGYKAVSANNFGRQVRRVFGVGESRPHRCAQGGVGKAWFGITPKLDL